MENNTKLGVGIVVLLAVIVLAWMWAYPKYRIYKQDLRGQADLREQEWSKRVLVEQAKAEKDSSELRAEAEIIRARGVAQANEIIGTSLRDNEQYLRYLWIQGLGDESSKVIYVPTEANLPILEANPNR